MNHKVVIKHLTELTDDEAHVLEYMNMGARGSMQRRFLALRGEERGWAIIHYDDLGYINGWGLMFEDRYLAHQFNEDQICLYLYVPSGWRRMGIGTALMDAARLVEPLPYVIPWDTTSGQFYSKQENFKVNYYDSWISRNDKTVIFV